MGRCVASGSVCRPTAGPHLTYPFGLHSPPGSCRVVHPTHVSGLSARAKGPYPPGYDCPCLTAGGLRFLGHLVPAAAWAGLPKIGRPTGPEARPQRGCRVPLPERCDGGGRLLYCGAWVSVSRLWPGAGPVARHRRDCHRGSGDQTVTQPRRRFTGVRPCRLSLARVHPDGFGLPLGFTRLLSHASLPGACAGREPTWTPIGGVGTQPTTTLQKRLSRRTGLHVIVAAFRAEIGSGIRKRPADASPSSRISRAVRSAAVTTSSGTRKKAIFLGYRC